ncbi:MAG: type II secretion system F family protein [Armatimonadota bacterium]|nr:type II secretion system F family protein [Armatimonadota bacterium]
MSLVLLFIAALVFADVLLILLTLMSEEGRARVERRIHDLRPERKRSPLAEKLSLPFYERAVLPAIEKVVKAVGGLAPTAMLAQTRAGLEKAGNPLGLSAHSFITVRVFSAIGGLAAAYWISASPTIGDNVRLPRILVVVTVGLLAPVYVLQKSIDRRHAEIRKALPDIIDLLVVSVEAGSGLDGALLEVVSRKEGPLPDEFERLLREIRVGKTRRRAWQDMAKRIDEENLSALVTALIQAEEVGVSIGKALRAQADSVRVRRSLQIRELAATLPVKMIFPLVFCIFPALFVILLGPGLLSLTDILGVLSGR